MSEGRRRWESQLKERENSPFLYLFVPFGPLTDWTPTLHWQGLIFLLNLLSQMLVSSGNSLTDTPRNNVLPALRAALSPVKLTYKINHHSALIRGGGELASSLSALCHMRTREDSKPGGGSSSDPTCQRPDLGHPGSRTEKSTFVT